MKNNFLFLIFFICTSFALARNPELDSLLNVLNTSAEDTNM